MVEKFSTDSHGKLETKNIDLDLFPNVFMAYLPA
jgi:hypothetical protein